MDFRRGNNFSFLFVTIAMFYSLIAIGQNKKKQFRLPKNDDEVVEILEPCTRVSLLIDGEPFDTSNIASIALDNIILEASLDTRRYNMFNMPPNVVVIKAYISLKRNLKTLFKIRLEPNLSLSSLNPKINDIYIVSVEEIVAFNKLGELLVVKNKHTFNIKLH